MTDITWTNDARSWLTSMPWENNLKRVSKKQATGCCWSIERFGFAVPFLVSPDGDIYDEPPAANAHGRDQAITA